MAHKNKASAPFVMGRKHLRVPLTDPIILRGGRSAPCFILINRRSKNLRGGPLRFWVTVDGVKIQKPLENGNHLLIGVNPGSHRVNIHMPHSVVNLDKNLELVELKAGEMHFVEVAIVGLTIPHTKLWDHGRQHCPIAEIPKAKKPEKKEETTTTTTTYTSYVGAPTTTTTFVQGAPVPYSPQMMPPMSMPMPHTTTSAPGTPQMPHSQGAPMMPSPYFMPPSPYMQYNPQMMAPMGMPPQMGMPPPQMGMPPPQMGMPMGYMPQQPPPSMYPTPPGSYNPFMSPQQQPMQQQQQPMQQPMQQQQQQQPMQQFPYQQQPTQQPPQGSGQFQATPFSHTTTTK